MNIFLIILFVFLIFSIIIIAIFEHSNVKKFFYWTTICVIFPVLGFIVYVIFGNNLKFQAKQKLMLMHKSTKNYISKTDWYNSYVSQNNYINQTARTIKNKYKIDIWHNNSIKLFLNGKDFVDDLILEIRNAKNTINLEFYIFSNDSTGNIVANELIAKAKQGVVVNIVYDAVGCKKTQKKFWDRLLKNNINVYPFFPNIINKPIINFKINHRNHRKIVVIDGKIGYTGGINIRNDHLGIKTKLKPWRDTQIKIKGSGCYSLQEIFLNDLSFACDKDYTKSEIKIYFPPIKNYGKHSCIIAESGPEKDIPYIYEIYSYIINSCKEFLYIQSPYFIIDNNLTNDIINAKNRGVKVKIIIPKKPDKKLVYGASLLCIKKLLFNDIDIYLYEGFIHAKTICTELVASIGSCNFDYRSFYLNFENACLLFDKKDININKLIFENDINNSIYLTKKKFNNIKIKNFLYIFIIKIISKLL